MNGNEKKNVGNHISAAVTIAVFLAAAALFILYVRRGEAAFVLPEVCGLGLSFRADGFRVIFALVTAYMWMMTTLFSGEYLNHSRHTARYYRFLLITLAAMLGLFLSDDLFTAFVFFEIMSMASYVCVIHEEKQDALDAGAVYLAVAVIGGMVTLMGLFMLYHTAGTLKFDELLPACREVFGENRAWMYVSGACILFGFGAKAGMYPLHIWLPIAHPAAPAPASALLSGIITKSGIFGVLVISSRIFLHDGYWGMVILLFGVVTMLCGGILALFSVDLKRTLACSSMSQLGFIFVGIGMMGLLGEENALAVRGTILHMFNHSNLKLVLFMAAGVVVMNIHKLNLNDIRGYGRKKPLLMYVFLMGSLGIAGVPLFNGYISKTLIHESIVEYIGLLNEGRGAQTFAFAAGADAAALFRVIEWLFIITGAMTVAYMLKLFAALFVEKNRDAAVQESFDEEKHYCTKLTAAVLAVSATVLPVLGVLPRLTLDKLADMGQGFLLGEAPEHAVQYFSLTNLRGGLYSIVIGVLIYVVLVRGWMMVKEKGQETAYVNRWPRRLDLLEVVYKPLVNVVIPEVLGFICRCVDGLTDGLIVLARKTTHRQLYEKDMVPKGYGLAVAAGAACNLVVGWLNRTVLRKHPLERDYILKFAENEYTLKQANRVITASISFSLLMFSIGMIVVVLSLMI